MKTAHAVLIGAFVVFAGCAPVASQDSKPIACTMEYRYGLTLTVKDQNGQPINDAKISVLEHDNPNDASAKFDLPGSDGQYVGLGEGSGHYKVRVEKSGYESQDLDVNLEHDACHVHPQAKDVTLRIKAL